MARRAKEPSAPPDEAEADHPRRAAQCLGHAAAEERFLETYNAGRLHHAWLLTGLKGVGKATFAYRAARFLLADAKDEAGGLFGAAAPPTSLDRSPDDPGVHRVAAGSHADLFTLEPERPGRPIAAEAARGLPSFLQLTAGEGAWRVVIIDAADDLNRTSANILLKQIEEPPRQTVLFLVSHSPGQLLPTIRSRCARLAFQPLLDESVARILAERRPEADSDAIAAAVALAGGAAGRGLALLDGDGAAIVTALGRALDGRRGDGLLLAEAFAGQVARAPFHYDLASETLMAWIAAASRPPSAPPPPGLTPDLERSARISAGLGPKPWIDLYAHAQVRFERVKAVNLDPAQTLVDILARAQALMARISA